MSVAIMVLFIMLYKVGQTFESVNKILKCDHSSESYGAVLSCGAVCVSIFCKNEIGHFFLFNKYGYCWGGGGGRSQVGCYFQNFTVVSLF